MAVTSISGVRGIFNRDLLPEDVCAYAKGFASSTSGKEVLVGRDTRSTGALITKLISGTLLGAGKDVVDYGIISTPALFRESRLKNAPALVVTASHNEPEWNGLKFVLQGRGINQEEFDRILAAKRGRSEGGFGIGSVRRAARASYNSEVVAAAGENSGRGISVVLDMNGGVAFKHAPQILAGIGCDVTTLGGVPGVFSRTIDPTNDPLELLSKTVREKSAQVGFAFDCDGDRLVMVDDEGRKRTGDYMLTLALMELLRGAVNRSVVVSTDTTMAVDDVVSRQGGIVYRSRVGEANVISEMLERKVRLGGEGSSGGLIDGEFNYCRDSMIAAVTIVTAIKNGGKGILGAVPSYSIARMKTAIDRRRATAAIKRLRKDYPESDGLDGLKIWPSNRSWVLIRPSGTEDAVRVSAEARSSKEARSLAESFVAKIERLDA